MTSIGPERASHALAVRHVDDHALWIDPANTDHLFIGGDGGVYESWDRGQPGGPGWNPLESIRGSGIGAAERWLGLISEGAAAVEEDEDHRRTGQGDQGQGSEVGDEMEIDAHADPRAA